MQGFFGKPVDNLFAEPLIARWIRINVPGWRDAVVVSKNAGGTKRVTSLADTLKLNFGIVTTDRRGPRFKSPMTDSTLFFDCIESSHERGGPKPSEQQEAVHRENSASNSLRPETPSAARRPSELEEADFMDERARDVITGRIVQGHLVDDDYPSPAISRTDRDDSSTGPIASSAASLTQPSHALGGSGDAAESDDDEAHARYNWEKERTITLVGDVKDKTVFMVDDIIDKSGSWIAAAETVVKKGGAKKVYCIATHGLFGDDSLERMQACQSINYIIVTNSFPIPAERVRDSRKLIIIDVSTLLAESIRRRHYGERCVFTLVLLLPSYIPANENSSISPLLYLRD